MAAAADAPPGRCQPILPAAHALVRRKPVLNEYKATVSLQHAPYFSQCNSCPWNGAHRPGREYGIDTVSVDWDRLRGGLNELDRHNRSVRQWLRHRDQLWSRLERQDFAY